MVEVVAEEDEEELVLAWLIEEVAQAMARLRMMALNTKIAFNFVLALKKIPVVQI